MKSGLYIFLLANSVNLPKINNSAILSGINYCPMIFHYVINFDFILLFIILYIFFIINLIFPRYS